MNEERKEEMNDEMKELPWLVWWMFADGSNTSIKQSTAELEADFRDMLQESKGEVFGVMVTKAKGLDYQESVNKLLEHEDRVTGLTK